MNRSVWSALRPINLAILAITQLLSLFLILTTNWHTSGFHPNILSWILFPGMLIILGSVMIAAAGNLHNDLHDSKADRINKNKKGIIAANKLELWRNILGNSGIILGIVFGIIYLDFLIPLIFLFTGFSLWLYSPSLKAKPIIGNILVSILSGLAVITLPAAWFESTMDMSNVKLFTINVNWLILTHPSLFYFAAFAFLASLCREIIKDLEDMEGDKAAGYQTFPIVKGSRTALILSNSIAVLMCVAILGVAYYLYKQGLILSGSYLIIPYILAMIWVFRNRNAKSKETYSQQSRFMKVIMGLGMAGMLMIILEVML